VSLCGTHFPLLLVLHFCHAFNWFLYPKVMTSPFLFSPSSCFSSPLFTSLLHFVFFFSSSQLFSLLSSLFCQIFFSFYARIPFIFHFLLSLCFHFPASPSSFSLPSVLSHKTFSLTPPFLLSFLLHSIPLTMVPLSRSASLALFFYLIPSS
jgi:hypothetical protein